MASPSATPDGTTSIDVPFLPQTEALCGGAAAAMLFRFWGEPHAGVQQFAPLVDRAAGGIATSALVDAIQARHWSAVVLDGTADILRRELGAGRPPLILIEDRPQRYHYLVVVGFDADAVFVHDPTWGPSRRLSWTALERAWSAAGFWMLRVTPAPGAPTATAAARATLGTTEPRLRSRAHDASCDAALDAALDEIGVNGLDHADAAIQPLIARCPGDPRPLRELAGVRFAQRRWADARAFADQALTRDPDDPFAADVLGSSRFMLNDLDGALRAWNLQDKPILDSVRITGLTRTRYALLAQALGLQPDTVLTADDFSLARRRLASMPDLSSTRLALRPGDDGFVVADVAVAERATLPHHPVQWAAAAAQSVLEREVALRVPGRTGQGETWTADWGWWEKRPRVAVAFAAPRVARLSGVWTVGLSWDAQTYGPATGPLREEHLRGDLGLSNWLTTNLRAEWGVGVDAWTRPDGRRDRMLHASASVERRLVSDHLSAQLDVARWIGMGGDPAFGNAELSITARSSRSADRLVVLARTGASLVSAQAPFALWSGAGEGRSRAPLLRAHTLLEDGRIDGPVFGRRLAHGTVELQHWLRRPTLLRMAAATFVDAAAAGARPAFATGRAFQVDAGIGVRVRVPGRSGLFRVDYARGLRDGSHAVLVGWQPFD